MRLGVVCSKIGSGATPRGGSESYLAEGPFALIRSQNIYNDGFRREGLAFIDESQAAALANVEVQGGDVLLNITGDSVARCCQVDPTVLPARVNQHVSIIRPNPRKLDSTFLRYAMVSPSMQSKLLQWASAGATRNALTKGMIEALEVDAPDETREQQAIARILGTLDDKIELNRRMNETLEAIARALFKSWFVDFDPVIDNALAAGHPIPEPLRERAEARTEIESPLPENIRQLFPASFQDSHLGPIPTDWNGGTLRDLANLSRDSTRPMQQPDAEFLHFSIPAFDSGQAAIQERGENIKSQKYVVHPDSVLVSKLNPEIERVWLPDVGDHPRAVCSTEFLVLQPRQHFGTTYLFALTLDRAFRDRLCEMVTGTSKSHQRVQPNAMLAVEVLLPTRAVAGLYEGLASPLLASSLVHRRESRTLAALRDTLLPKLISGELRLEDPERFLTEAD